ncbi:CHASE domain-containing protein [Lysobacter sp. 2RAF19]
MVSAPRSPTAPDAPRATPGFAGFALAVLVLIATVALVLTAWRAARENALAGAQAEFHGSTSEIVELLQQRLVNYELTIRGGAALFASVARPSPAEWHAYVDGLNLAQRFPAMTGLGYAAYVSHYGMQRLQIDTRDAGRGLLTIWPRGERERYGPILYLEPRTAENLSAVGFDMYSDPARRAAMRAAMREAMPRMSARVKLVQDLDPKPGGFLMYVPVFPGGLAPPSGVQRESAITGWVYAPIRAKRFVEVGLAPINRTVTFRLYDITDGGRDLVYADPAHREGDAAAFHETITVRAYGRQWQFEFASGPLETAAPALVPLRTALIVGLLASLLLFGIVWSLAHTELRAQRLAARMSLAARRSEARVRALNRSLEARVETRTRELSEANRELETFAYSVSHDLRAPLRAIEGFGRVLEDRYAPVLDDTGRGYLERVRNAAARMSELIEGLLKLSRVARGDLMPERLDLSRMAGDIIADLRTLDPHRPVTVDIAPTLVATADAAMVRSLLTNLLSNAWKFTREREQAFIAFAQHDDGETFYVQDNGVGFDQAYVDKLFRPFQRLHDDAHFAGEGIGLATVKRIVERHGGTITATGEAGKGAVFAFTLKLPG